MNRVTIIGVGALGSHLLQFLRNSDATLVCVDYDRVEQKNTQSQFHGKPHVGKLKAEAAKQTFNLLWGRKIETFPSKLVENNARALLDGSSLMIDCLDNAASRRVLQSYAREKGTPCLHGAVDANGSFGRVVWDEQFVIDDEAGLGQATCEDGAHLPFLAIVAGYLAHAAQLFVREGKKVGFVVHPGGATRT
jgi:molybdopterin-synthase adenylyltransferase